MKNNIETNDKPTMLVFCCGIGLVSQAAKETGYNVKGCIDFAEIPRLSYQANFPEVPFLKESLRKVSAKFLCKHFGILPKKLDTLQISTPCTGWSTTGTFEPTHSDNEIFFLTIFLALQIKSRVVLWENVSGLTWKKMQMAFAMLSHFFKKMEEEYHIETVILNSNNYGDSQSRERLFIMCVRKDVGRPKWPVPERDQMGKTIGDALPHVDYLVNKNFGERVYEKNEPAPTITAHANIIVGTEGIERKITPRELAKLFGLPDTFKLVGNEEQQIKGIGNGVPVGLTTALLLTIKHDILGYPKPEDLKLRSIPNDLFERKGYVIYEGKSAINGEEIVAIVTAESANEKTGNMAQLWILNADTDPIDATKTGKDESVCGNCNLRHFKNGPCYVYIGKEPQTVWKSWKNGLYAPIKFEDLHLFTERPIRFGAYGDPFAIPLHLLEELKKFAGNTTGYTHQWQRKEAEGLKPLCMASVENPQEYQQAVEAGWRTFRIIKPEDSLLQDEILCPNLTSGVQCRDCNLCTGTSSKAKNIAIQVHGAHKKRFNATINTRKNSVDVIVATPIEPSTEAVTVTRNNDVMPSEVRNVCVTDSNFNKVKQHNIISSQDLVEMEFTSLEFQGKWNTIFGLPSINFHCIIHGMPGQGKSTFAVQLAKYLSNFGRIIYVSGEEGFNSTFKDKFVNNCAVSGSIDVADLRCLQDILREVEPGKYNFIVIDSLDTMKLGPVEVRQIKNLHTTSALITISQSTKAGLIRGSNEIVHDADIAVKCVDGIAITTKNRFKPNGMTYEIFGKPEDIG